MIQTVFVYGAGSIGMRHLRLLSEMDAVRPVAVPVRPERVAELRAMGFEATADLTAGQRRNGAPAIICTDTSRHVEDALRLLDGGPLLIEKPLGIDAADTAALLDAAAGRRDVLVAYPLRFSNVVKEVAALTPQLGALSAVRVECQSWLPSWRPGRDYRSSYSARAAEGGVLRDLSHELDYTIQLVGRPGAVTCVIPQRILDIEAEDAADILWRTENGAVVSIRLDYVTRTTRRRVMISGSDGFLEADLVSGSITGVVADETFECVVDAAPDTMYRAQLAAFLRGGGTQMCTLAEAAYTMKVIDASRRAAASGCMVPVVGSA